MKRLIPAYILALTTVCIGKVAFAEPVLSSYEKAYDREIQMLQKEKAVFDAHLVELENKSTKTIGELRKEAASLGDELTRIRLANDRLEEQVQRIEMIDAEGNEARGKELELLWQQSNITLQNMGLQPFSVSETPETDVVTLFHMALSKVKHLSGVRVENGEWYDQKGKKRKGEVLHVSGVSAFGLDEKYGGSLIPNSNGIFQVVAPLNQSVLEYSRSSQEALVDTFLYDPLLDTHNSAPLAKSIWQMFLAGGLVMWPILALAVLGVFIVFERLFVLRRIHTNADRLMKKVGLHILDNAWDTARSVCERNRGAVAQVMEVILRNRQRSRQQQEELAYEVILAQKPKMERFLSVLNIIAAVAPLLGLLGTVTGMIGTFDIISAHGTGDPKMLSVGISEALLTTQFGLIVAIPALFAHAVLSSRVDHVMGDVETNSMRLLNQLHVNTDVIKNRGDSDCDAMAVSV
ncbi:MAG: MotA/TolQ/ExbB proton channel family protein [Deltaproteobacteria bacterium]|nr:MotA/TolQ/ExbB proton channel family protein [Deltaproteobacteria bacterium]